MSTKELQTILQSNNSLTLSEIKEIIYQLKNDCIRVTKSDYETGFYDGEVNAFYICLDLLDKMEETK